MLRNLAFAVLTSLLIGCGNPPSQAKQSAAAPAAQPASRERYVEAADALIGSLGKPGQGPPTMPSTSDRTVARYLSEAQSLRAALGTADMPATNVGEGLALCGKGAEIQLSYQLAGLAGRLAKDSPAAQVAEETQKLMVENTKKYFATIFPIMLFNQHCYAAYAPAIERWVASAEPGFLNEERLGGLRQMRTGDAQIITGMLLMFADPGATAKGREVIWKQLDADWDGLALMLSPVERRSVQEVMERLAPYVPADARASYATLGPRLQGAACGVVCSIR